MFLVPLVALGRIYYQCHFIGDTLAGGMIGFFYANMSYIHFDKIATFIMPMFTWLTENKLTLSAGINIW